MYSVYHTYISGQLCNPDLRSESARRIKILNYWTILIIINSVLLFTQPPHCFCICKVTTILKSHRSFWWMLEVEYSGHHISFLQRTSPWIWMVVFIRLKYTVVWFAVEKVSRADAQIPKTAVPVHQTCTGCICTVSIAHGVLCCICTVSICIAHGGCACHISHVIFLLHKCRNWSDETHCPVFSVKLTHTQ